jgi:outer membrane protein
VKNAVFFLMAAVAFAAGPALAAERIGYVDVQRVVTESAAGKRAFAEMESQVKQKQEQVNREGQKLKAQQQALEKEQLTLTDAQKRAKQREFEKKVQAYQQLAATAQRELSDLEAERTNKVITDIRGVIREVAQQEKLLLVLQKNEQLQPVLYAADGPDLTDKVIKAYDAKKR